LIGTPSAVSSRRSTRWSVLARILLTDERLWVVEKGSHQSCIMMIVAAQVGKKIQHIICKICKILCRMCNLICKI
jgi:hypothetical protein